MTKNYSILSGSWTPTPEELAKMDEEAEIRAKEYEEYNKEHSRKIQNVLNTISSSMFKIWTAPDGSEYISKNSIKRMITNIQHSMSLNIEVSSSRLLQEIYDLIDKLRPI